MSVTQEGERKPQIDISISSFISTDFEYEVTNYFYENNKNYVKQDCFLKYQKHLNKHNLTDAMALSKEIIEGRFQTTILRVKFLNSFSLV